VQSYRARDFLTTDPKQLYKSLGDQDITLIFDDGEVVTKTRKLIYSLYFWELHSKYPNTPLNKNHFVDHVLRGGSLTSNTHIDLLSNIAKDVFIYHSLDKPEQKEPVFRLIYEITNKIYNEISKMAEACSTSIDILDFIEIAEHPQIKHSISKTIPHHESISKTYSEVLNVIEKDPELKNNSLVKAVRSKMVNSNQVAQCVAIRGFLTEVDGTILPVPILSNFTRGLGSLYNLVAESRSAAKSYYFSETPLKESEYFARRLQILCMTVEHIHYEDCGSTEYMNWRVNPPIRDETGKTIYPGDLKFMLGKYYYDDQTHSLKVITHDDPNLYGKVIRLRTVLNCKHPDPHGVCEVCFGQLAKNVSRFANIGHLCSATMTQQTSQSVLSTKHLDASSVSSNIQLTKNLATYFTVNSTKNAYILKKELANKRVTISVDRDSVQGLTDILNIESIENINPLRISYISEITISVDNGKQLDVDILFVNQENRKAMLTIEFLKFLKKNKWETDNRNNFIFQLDGWDYDKPILKLPDMEYSYADHSKQIASVIEATMDKNVLNNRNKPESPYYTLQELFNLVNTKLNVNIAALEIIVYANMVRGINDFGLTRNQNNKVLNVSDNVIKNRSLGAAFAYEKQADVIRNPKSFFKDNRPDSVFDVFIAPKEVVAHYKQRK
jgi:hypothetical protein